MATQESTGEPEQPHSQNHNLVFSIHLHDEWKALRLLLTPNNQCLTMTGRRECDALSLISTLAALADCIYILTEKDNSFSPKLYIIK